MRKQFLAVFVTILVLFTFCDKNQIKTTQVITLLDTYTSWNGDTLPHYVKGRPKIKILKISIPPKAKLKTHKHPVINAGVLLKGSLKVVTETGDILYLKEGDAISEVINIWHHGENESNEIAEIIVFYATDENTPITILKE